MSRNATRPCPYRFCSRQVDVLPSTPREDQEDPSRVISGIIAQHDVKHPYLSGPCPASLMRWPLANYARRVLMERANQDGPRISGAIGAERERELKELLGIGPPYSESTPVHGPHRMGREPGPEDESWALGGRQDEDIQQYAAKPPAIQPGVHGESVGRGTGMATIGEVQATLAAADTRVGEAHATMIDMEDKWSNMLTSLEEAEGYVHQVLGDAHSDTLSRYLGILQQAKEGINHSWAKLKEVEDLLPAAQDCGQEYANSLHG